MEPLSAFAIHIAAGIAIEFYEGKQKTVTKELQKAFNKTLNIWCPNKSIRNFKRAEIKRKLLIHFENPEHMVELSVNDSELNSFLIKYGEVLPEYYSAYNYIKEIKDLERYKNEISFLSSIKSTVEDIQLMLTNHIVKNLPQKNKILETEWIRQLETYKESIGKFKPKTALNLLIKLEDSFISNDSKPSNSLLASIEFLKAQCYELICNYEEMYKSFIKANKLNPSLIQFKEKSCFSYAKIGEFELAEKLSQDILNYDEFNSYAWAVKIIISENKDLENILSATPKIVVNNSDFKRLIYFNTFPKPEYKGQAEVYYKYSFFSEIYSFDEGPITLGNYKERLFLIETTLTRLFQSAIFDLTNIKSGNIDLLKFTNRLLAHFLMQLSESEILDNFKVVNFCYLYTEFVLNEKIESVFKMKESFSEINRKDEYLLMMMANSLQLIGQEEDAINIINVQKNKSTESLFLKAYCNLKKSDIENYVETVKEFLSSIKKIDFNNCENILSISFTLYRNNKLHEIEISEFTENKEFEVSCLKILIESFLKILKRSSGQDEIQNLLSIEQILLETKSEIIFYIPFSFFILEEFNLAINSFKKYISFEKESMDLYY